jgi:hypothetical protein
VNALLSSVDVSPPANVLWSTQYQQRPTSGTANDHILRFSPPPADIAFDDAIFDRVKVVWERIMGDAAGEFLVFQDREAYDDDDDN